MAIVACDNRVDRSGIGSSVKSGLALFLSFLSYEISEEQIVLTLTEAFGRIRFHAFGSDPDYHSSFMYIPLPSERARRLLISPSDVTWPPEGSEHGRSDDCSRRYRISLDLDTPVDEPVVYQPHTITEHQRVGT